jgi:hypothetical protein
VNSITFPVNGYKRGCGTACPATQQAGEVIQRLGPAGLFRRTRARSPGGGRPGATRLSSQPISQDCALGEDAFRRAWQVQVLAPHQARAEVLRQQEIKKEEKEARKRELRGKVLEVLLRAQGGETTRQSRELTGNNGSAVAEALADLPRESLVEQTTISKKTGRGAQEYPGSRLTAAGRMQASQSWAAATGCQRTCHSSRPQLFSNLRGDPPAPRSLCLPSQAINLPSPGPGAPIGRQSCRRPMIPGFPRAATQSPLFITTPANSHRQMLPGPNNGAGAPARRASACGPSS